MKVNVFLFVMVFVWVFALSGCANGVAGQPPAGEQEEQMIMHLSFKPKSIVPLQPQAPDDDWSIAHEQRIGNAAILVYQDESGNSWTFARYEAKTYMLGGAYPAETMKIQPLESEFGGIKLIGGVGSDLTAWDILGLDKEGKFITFQAIGRPEIMDLDGNGTTEIVASFEGAHLHFPNVEIFKVTHGQLESAEVTDPSSFPIGEDLPYARFFKDNSTSLIMIGKAHKEGAERLYRYEDGHLLEVSER